VLCNERFAHKVTEVWFGAVPFFASGQIRGVPLELAKELCLRRLEQKSEKSSGRLVKVENKRVFRSREGFSPDDSDSFLLGVEHLRTRHGFTPAELPAEPLSADVSGARLVIHTRPDGSFTVGPPNMKAANAWETFKARARRSFKSKGNLQR